MSDLNPIGSKTFNQPFTMPESKIEQGSRPFPLKGYLLINAVVWAVCIAIYLAFVNGWFSTVSIRVQRPAFGGVLLFVALAFLVGSIFDYAFDRIRIKVEHLEDEEVKEGELTPSPRSEDAE